MELEAKMARFLKTRSKVLGLHPGSLVYIGQSGDMEKVNINLINYTKESFFESNSATLEKCVESAKDTSHITWIEFQGLSNKAVIEEIGNQFGIHRLWLEDILNTDHRPKVEEMDNMLFSIIKYITAHEENYRVVLKASQTSIFFGNNFVLCFYDMKHNIFEPIKERLRKSIWKIRSSKADYLFYAIIDLLIDQYYIVLEEMGNAFEELEKRVTANVNKINPSDILSLKGEFLYLRKTIFPVKEAISKMILSNHPWIESNTLKYFKDIQDHTLQIIEIIEYYNELSTSLMGFYQNTINQKMNEVMKVLTLFAAIFIPLTFVVGIYGMNFKFMPELEWKYGYLLVWVIIVVLSGGMFFFFKKKKWI